MVFVPEGLDDCSQVILLPGTRPMNKPCRGYGLIGMSEVAERRGVKEYDGEP